MIQHDFQSILNCSSTIVDVRLRPAAGKGGHTALKRRVPMVMLPRKDLPEGSALAGKPNGFFRFFMIPYPAFKINSIVPRQGFSGLLPLKLFPFYWTVLPVQWRGIPVEQGFEKSQVLFFKIFRGIIPHSVQTAKESLK